MSQCQCHNNQTPQGQGACSSQQGDFVLSQAERDAIEHEKHHYEDPRAASIEALKIVQQARGWVPDGAIHAIGADANGDIADTGVQNDFIRPLIEDQRRAVCATDFDRIGALTAVDEHLPGIDDHHVIAAAGDRIDGLANVAGIRLSVSTTTRPPRPGCATARRPR